MKDNNLFQQTNQSYNTPVLFDEKPNLKPGSFSLLKYKKDVCLFLN